MDQDLSARLSSLRIDETETAIVVSQNVVETHTLASLDLKAYTKASNATTVIDEYSGKISHSNLLSTFVLDNAKNNMLCTDISAVDVLYGAERIDDVRDLEVLRPIFSDDVAVLCLYEHAPDEKDFKSKETLFATYMADLRAEFQRIVNGSSELGEKIMDIKLMVCGSLPPQGRRKDFLRSVPRSTDRKEVLERNDLYELENLINYRSKTERYICEAVNKGDGKSVVFPHYDPKKHCRFMHFKFSTKYLSYERSIAFIEFIHRPDENIVLFRHDLAIDLACVFHRVELENFLRRHGYTIRDMVSTMGNYLLSAYWTEDVEQKVEIPTVFKAYIKNIEMWTVGSMKYVIGDKMHYWVNSPDKYLNDEILQSLDKGFTRLEVSFYGLRALQNIETKVDVVTRFFNTISGSNKLYSLSVAEQWSAIASNLRNNAFLIDYSTGEYLLANYCDVSLGRVMGSYGWLTMGQRLSVDNFVEYVKLHFSIPGVYFHLVELGKMPDVFDRMTITLTTWNKEQGQGQNSLLWRGMIGGLMYDNDNDPRRYPHHHRVRQPTDVGIVMPYSTIVLHQGHIQYKKTRLFGGVAIDESGSVDKLVIRNARYTTGAEALTFSQESSLKRALSALDYNRGLSLINDFDLSDIGKVITIVAIKEYPSNEGPGYLLLDSKHIKYRAVRELFPVIETVKAHPNVVHNECYYYLPDNGAMFSFRVGEQYSHESIYRRRFNQILPLVGQATMDSVAAGMGGITFNVCTTIEEGTYVVKAIRTRKFGQKEKYILAVDDKYYKGSGVFDAALQVEISRLSIDFQKTKDLTLVVEHVRTKTVRLHIKNVRAAQGKQ